MPLAQINVGRIILVTTLFATPVLLSQTSRTLKWSLEQQPTSVSCSSEDIVFANAPEQVFLEKSYNLLPQFPLWKCESIKAPAFNDARVLIISKPSMIDDGLAFTLIQLRGSANVRLLPFSEGGQLFRGNEGDRHNLAAMNAILQTSKYGPPETIDWLALSLAYLTIVGEEPDLADQHYSPGPTDRYFKSYTVPGLLTEQPALTEKHLLPMLSCAGTLCTVHFYYRTEPVMPLKVADLEFLLRDGSLCLLRAHVEDFEADDVKKGVSH